jgi:hypothetical protein
LRGRRSSLLLDAKIVARGQDRGDDVLVPGATTEHRRQDVTELALAGVGMLLEISGQQNEDAGGAETALETMVLLERLLQRMKRLVVRREALDRPDRRTFGLDGEDEARADRFAVELNCAHAADPVLAPEVGARQAAVIPEGVG